MNKLWFVIIAVVLICTGFTVLIEGVNEMKIETKGGTIYGELIDCGKETIVMFVAGSGATDRDGNSAVIQGKNDSFLQLALELKKKGISTFRYDKRSAGKSAESFDMTAQVYFDDFPADCAACIRLLREKGFEKIIVAGHSQGSLVGMLAAQQEKIDGFISISGAGTPIGEVMYRQYASQLGEDCPQAATIKMLMDGDIDESMAGGDPLFTVSNQKFILSWMAYGPAEEIAKLNCPVMVVQGSEDLQTAPSDFEKLAEATGTDGTMIPGMNHVLKKVTDMEDNIKSYQDPAFNVHPDLIISIVDFLNREETIRGKKYE